VNKGFQFKGSFEKKEIWYAFTL